MAAVLERLVVQLDAEIDAYQEKLGAAGRAIDRLADRAREAGQRLSLYVTAPLTALAATSVHAAAQLDSLRRGLQAVTGSAAEADAILRRMEDVARLPGLGFREAVEGATRLQVLGLSAREAERILRAVANAVALTGGGREELEGVIVAISQAIGKGRLMAEELQQIAERAPIIRRALMDAFGTGDVEAISDAARQMGLSVEQVIGMLVAQLERLPRVTGGVRNEMENLSDSWFRARAAIGEALLPSVVAAMGVLGALLERIRTMRPATLDWVVAIGALTAAVGPALVVIGSLSQVLLALRTLLGATAAMTGLVGLLLAIAAAAGLAVHQMQRLRAAMQATQRREAIAGLSDNELARSRAERARALRDIERQRRALAARLAPEPRAAARLGSVGALAVGQIDRAQRAQLEALERTAAREREIIGLIDAEIARRRRLRAEAERSRASYEAEVARLRRLLGSTRGEGGERRAARDAVSRAVEIDAEAGRRRLEERLELVLRPMVRGDQQARPIGAQPAVAAPPMRPLPALDALLAQASAVGGALGALAGGAIELLVHLRQTAGALAVWGRSLATSAMQRGEEAMRAALDSAAAFASNLTPAGLAASALAAVLEALRPALDALQQPLRVVGGLLASVIAPVLAALTPPLRLLATAVSYVVEGLGALLRAIARAVNRLLPGSPLRGLERFGQSLVDEARDARRALREGTDGARELGEAARETAGALRGLPQIFDYALRRRQAAQGVAPAWAPLVGALGSTAPAAAAAPAIAVHVHRPEPGVDAARLASDVGAALATLLRRGQLPGLQVALAEMR